MADRAYHHGDLAQALIDAAVGLLADEGIAALSLRAVARRAGVSHAAPAHHFGDRAGLLTAVAVQGYRLFHAALAAARDAAGDDPIAAFAATGRAYVHFAVEQRPYFELMFRLEHLRGDDPELVAASGDSYQLLLDAVEAAQRAGFAPEHDPRDLALSAWASVHGLAMLWLDGNLTGRVDLPLDALIDRVLVASGAKLGGH